MLNSVEYSETGTLWHLLEECLQVLCSAWSTGKFVPVLEADFAGYLYHLLVVRCDGNASWVHLSTRLYRATEKNEKYDLVVGPVVTTEEQKHVLHDRSGTRLSEELKRFIDSKASLRTFRPATDGRLILEFKAFPIRFTPEQHRVHLTEAIEDIKELKAVAAFCPKGRAVVLFDDDNYITETRRGTLVDARGPLELNLRIYLCQRTSPGAVFWTLL